MEVRNECRGVGDGHTGRRGSCPSDACLYHIHPSFAALGRNSIVWSPLCDESYNLFGLSISTLRSSLPSPPPLFSRFGIRRGAFSHADDHYSCRDGVPVAVHRLETGHHGRISTCAANSQETWLLLCAQGLEPYYDDDYL